MISKITPEKVRNPESGTTFVERIPFMSGRPTREITINNDDIIDLIIACNTCGSFEDFFQKT